MKEYGFSIEEKVKTWRRHDITINANSYEEAIDKVKSFISFDSVNIPNNVHCNSEILHELEENILISENEDEPTIIIFDERKEKEVYDNSQI